MLEVRRTPSTFTSVPPADLGGQAAELRAVSAAAPTDAWAVGAAGHFRTLAEHWDGAGWTAAATPNVGTGYNLLNGVADVAADDAWAVGQSANASNHYDALIEHWDGSQWSVVPSPTVGAGDTVLNAVTAVSANDIWAAGWHRNAATLVTQPLTEHWDGQAWSVVASPTLPGSPSLFFGIAAASTNDVWAVGRTGRHAATLIEHWDGTSWTVAATPPGGPVLSAVSVASANDVWAVGGGLTEHWDGTSWTVVPGPTVGNLPVNLTGVAVGANGQVWAVGGAGFGVSNQTVVAQWDGQAWEVVPSPSPGTLTNGLAGVAALPTGEVFTVGSFSDLDGNQPGPSQALILQNGAGAPDLATADSASADVTVLPNRNDGAGPGRAAAPRPSAERARAVRLRAADAVFAGSRPGSPSPVAAPQPVAAAVAAVVAAGRPEVLLRPPAPPAWADARIPPHLHKGDLAVAFDAPELAGPLAETL
jgi:hypothetical protein